MAVKEFFPTQIYYGDIQSKPRAFCNSLKSDCFQIRDYDLKGKAWSKKNYPNGYTSYSSLNDIHMMTSTFIELREKIDQHLKKFLQQLDYQVRFDQLFMSDCWLNIMPKGAYHGLHLHPLSFISGTFYVQANATSPGIKFEDPRLSRMLAQPPKKDSIRIKNKNFIQFAAKTGKLILFESWLRHEVPMNTAKSDRISISFNYSWRD